ncbi:MAG: EAL domain-containing protein [Rhizobiaceae bacterium]
MRRPHRVGDAIERLDNGLSVGHYAGYTLYSAYQPIFRYIDGEILDLSGLEGLIRPFVDDVSITPSLLFGQTAPEDALFIECMCHALHIRNYLSAAPNNCDLFININPAIYNESAEMEREFLFLLNQLAINGLDRSRIVFELLETVPTDNRILRWLRDFATEHQVRFALDDFGRGESNIPRYESLMPDLVKIDGLLFARAMERASKMDLLESIIARVHDDGGRIVIEGIETSEMLVLARELGADMFQGYHLDTPHVPPHQFFETTRPHISHAIH